MKKLFLIAIAICFLAGVPLAAHAQLNKALGNLQSTAGTSGLQPDLAASASNVIKVVLSLVGTIFLALTIYAGVTWMTASGDEKRIEKAKQIISTSIVGLIIVLAAYAITYFITTKLGGNSPGQNQNCGCGVDAQGNCIVPCNP